MTLLSALTELWSPYALLLLRLLVPGTRAQKAVSMLGATAGRLGTCCHVNQHT
jgi:hypothetical protein